MNEYDLSLNGKLTPDDFLSLHNRGKGCDVYVRRERIAFIPFEHRDGAVRVNLLKLGCRTHRVQSAEGVDQQTSTRRVG